MKFRRAGAALLAAALSATSMSVYALAEEDQAMKTALTYVKQRIDIPEEYEKFTYTTQSENLNTRYRFTWERTDEESNTVLDRIRVDITGKVIKSVNIWHNTSSPYYKEIGVNDTSIVVTNPGYEDEWKPSFAKMSDKKLLAAAKKYIKQINPTIYKNIECDEDIDISLYGNEATLGFQRTANGIPVTNQRGNVTIDKNTGELIGYYFYSYVNGATFSGTDGAISLEDAQKAYKELFPAELVYTLEYDYTEKKYTPHLIYSQTKNGQINAFTGELSKFEDYDSYGGIGDGDDDIAINEEATMADDVNPGTGGDAKAVSFTEAEIMMLEKEKDLVKAEDKLEELKKQGLFYIPTVSEVTWQNSYFDEYNECFMRSVSFTADNDTKYIDLNWEDIPYIEVGKYDVYGSFTYNAETGELQSFYCWAEDDKSGMDEKEAASTADAMLDKIVGKKIAQKFGDFEVSYKNTTYNKYDSKTGKGIGTPRITSITFDANRVENGIDCRNENVYLTLSNNGYITSYNINYHPEIEYPKPEKIISVNKAFKKYFDQVELALKYRCAYKTDEKKVVTALVYSTDQQLMIDAFTGKRTNYNGTEITEAEKVGDYTDLENSKYKKYAEKLKKYGITLMDKDGKLNENETITAEEFCSLISCIGFYYSDDSIKSDAKLDRRSVAYILVTSKYGKDIASLKNIFKSKFSDVKDTNKYVGYIMIADATGLITGKGNKFDPKGAFTRGDALMFVYNQLSTPTIC